MRKVFAPKHVDALIPRLEKVFEHIRSCYIRAETLASQALVSKEASPDQLARAQILKSQTQFLMEAVQEDIDHIASLGGSVKDIEAGLVDFPGIIDGQDVWLCWKRGESQVFFWHPLHAGAAERQPLRRYEDHTRTH